jgi:Protein of unknown function (DUF1360)
MSVLTEAKSKVSGAARAAGERYGGGADRPLRGYVAAMGTYAGLVGAIAAAARAAGAEVPDGLRPGDIGLAAVATHKLSRLLTRDPVTSPLRAPFTAYRGTEGPAELAEDARGRGGQKTVGELITCPFCTGVWIATGLTAGLIFAPRATRLAAGTLTALAGADVLQYAHTWLDKAAS